DFDNRLPGDADGAGLRIQALAAAAGTAHAAHVFFELRAPRTGGGLLEAGHELRNDPFPLAAMVPQSAAMLPGVPNEAIAAAVQQPIPVLLGEFFPRLFEIDSKRFGDAFKNVPPPAAHGAERADHLDRTGCEALLLIGNEQVRIEIVLDAEAVAVEAH